MQKRGVLHTSPIRPSILLFALFFVMLIASSSSALAYFYEFIPDCGVGPCIEGRRMNWTVLLENEGKRKIEYTKIELIDNTNKSTLFVYDLPFRPLNSDRGEPIQTIPTLTTTLTFEAPIPAANYYGKIYFHPCFTNIVSDTYVLAKYGEYTTRHCYDENLSLPILECVGNKDCRADQFCSVGLCYDLECGACQYLFNNSCVSYGCCADTDCSYNELCADHTCVRIDCLDNQYLYNRTCIDITCEDHEVLINRTCVALSCPDGQAAINHTCTPITCRDNEIVRDNRCVPIICRPTEGIVNKTCVPLNCKPNQAYQNNSCVALTCPIYQVVGNHVCTTDSALVAKFLIEILVLLAIVAFLFLDLYTYRHRHEHGSAPPLDKKQARRDAASSSLGSEGKTLKESLAELPTKEAASSLKPTEEHTNPKENPSNPKEGPSLKKTP